jgi:hypothetical protein
VANDPPMRSGSIGSGFSSSSDDRPTIEITPNEHVVNDKAVEALKSDKSLFERGALVTVVYDGTDSHGIHRPAGAPRIVPVVTAGLRERFTKVARFVKRRSTKKGDSFEHVHPPEFCAPAVLVRGNWPGIRRLNGVITSPVLRPDGTIVDTAGYDRATGLLYEPSGLLINVPSYPTAQQVNAAVESVLEIFADFPFATIEHKATAVAYVLTPLCRHAHYGPAPVFVSDSNVRGSGKTKLLQVGARIGTGRDLAVMTAPENDAEARKLITSIAIEGDSVVLIDNIGPQGFGLPSLDAAFTSTTWKDRLLSRNETIELPMLTTWCASGNNVTMRADTARRVAHISLDSPLENPEERTGFKHPDLIGWVVAERPRLLSAALTILRGYCDAGRPSQGLPPWGSFEGWSDLVRQAVVWAGLADPGLAREELRLRSDSEASGLAALILAWPEIDVDGTGVTASALVNELDKERDDYQHLRATISELCPAPPGKLPGARSVGSKFRQIRGRVVGGKFFDCRPVHGIAKWFIRSLAIDPNSSAQGRDGGFGGCATDPSPESNFTSDGEWK